MTAPASTRPTPVTTSSARRRRAAELLGVAMSGATAAGVALAIADAVWAGGSPAAAHVIGAVERLVAVLLFLDPVLRFRRAPSKRAFARTSWPDLVTLALAGAALADIAYFRALVLARLGVAAAKRFLSPAGGEELVSDLLRRPARVLVLTFAGVIAAGVVLLSLPGATRDGQGTPFVDALFTATSATCVTGLAVRDTAVYFTPFGQAIIAVLFQIGGLGIMTLTTGVALLFGRRVGLRQAVVSHAPVAAEVAPDMRRVLRDIIAYTAAIEGLGTLLLLPTFLEREGELLPALASAAFHAVSAFCNAGFALQSNGLEPFRGSLAINVVVPALIVLGGLGFVVLSDLVRNALPRRRPWGWRRLQPHTRVVVAVSASLIVAGAAFIFFSEFDHSLRDLPLGEKVSASVFLSVSSRTAGFNTLPMGHLADLTLFVLLVFMFVGGSPGSTAGGIKTTTLAVLLWTVRATVLGRAEVEVVGRTIPRRAVNAAIATTLLAALAVALGLVVLVAAERAPFMALLFEAVSAFGTVGLSTGITPDLGDAGKGVLVLLMFVGRLGPVTLALALARRVPARPVAYPEAEILVG